MGESAPLSINLENAKGGWEEGGREEGGEGVGVPCPQWEAWMPFRRNGIPSVQKQTI